ncbi:MAG: tail fiber domain-containing protein, partial [Pseudonocardiaceae bacterium]
VQHNGNVGIGTTKPAAKLEISGGGRDNVDLLVNGRLRSNNNDGGLWIAEDRFVGGHSTNQIGFFNAGTWHLTVLPTGHVGIGTTAPENADGWNKVVDILGSGSAKLSVRTARVDARVLAHDGGFFGSPVGMIVGTKSNHALSFGTNAASRLTISATGNVGIGTTNPSSDLEIGNFDARNRYLTLKVRGGNEYRSGIKLWTWQENYGYSLEYDERKGTGNGLHIRTHSKNADGTTRLFVGWDNGNVGIGTADPDGHRLCVRGGSTYLEGDIFVQGRLAYWWGGDNNWKHVQNRWDNYAGSYDTGGPSDGRLKTAVRPIRNALDKISRLEGIGYRWNEAGVEYLTRDIATSFSAGPGATAEENRRLWDEQRRKAVGTLSGEYLGLIAQDVDAVVPEVVHEDADGYKHIRYAHLTALLIEAVKEQQAAIEHLRARLVTVEPATA